MNSNENKETNNVSNQQEINTKANAFAQEAFTNGSFDNNNKISKIKFILPVVLVLVTILGIGGFWLTKNPKKIFNKFVSEGFAYLYQNMSTNNLETIGGKGSFSYDISVNDASVKDILDIFNGITMDYEYKVDYKDKRMMLDLSSKYKNEDLIALSMYTKDSKAYVLLKDVYDKYLVSDIEGYDNLFSNSNNNEDIKTILQSVEKALNKSVTNDDFKTSTETIKINGKEVKTTKNSLVINNESYGRIFKKFSNALLDDDKFIEAVSKLSGDSKENLKESLKASMSEDVSLNNTEIIFSIYTKGLTNDIVKFALDVESNNTIVNLALTKTDSNKYDLAIGQNGIDMIIGSINIDKKSDNERTINLELNMQNILNIKLMTNYSIASNVEFNDLDVSDNINYEELSSSEAEEISNKLMATKGLAELINNINELFGLNEEENNIF